MSKNQKIVFVSILAISIFFIFFRLTRHDMAGDDAHYAFRSIAYFDYMTSEEQTTPVQWFGNRPSWSYFGMHDHPPLVFLIQNIFFKFFGVSVLVTRLPAALAAVGSLLLIYFIGKKLGTVNTGLFSMAALAFNNHFIWTGRVGLLESVFIFFLLLGIYYLVRAVKGENRYFLWSGFYFGLSLLSKYTFLFVLPAILIYLVWKQRWVFRNKKFWLGMLLFLVLVSPIFIYNVDMYQARGHFDVQFSDLFNQQHNDWPKLQERVNLNFDPSSVLAAFSEIFSLPYLLTFLISFGVGLFLAVRQKESPLWSMLLIFLILFGFFSMIGSSERWLGVFAPFMALIIGLVLERGVNFIGFKKIAFFTILGALVLYCGFYILNTNSLRKAVANSNFYSSSRVENLGYNQLDEKISNILRDKKASPITQEAVRLWWYGKMQRETFNFASINQGKFLFNSLIIFDSNHRWFPALWTFEKWKLFHRIPIMTVEEFLQVMASENGIRVLNELGLDSVYMIKSGETVRANSDIQVPLVDKIFNDFGIADIQPEIVYDDQGREAFYIYYRKVNGFVSE